MYFLVLLSALLASVAGVPHNTKKPRLDGRIIGGNITDITSHPYQVAVLNFGYHRCSGSIISANWMVTTAACLSGDDSSMSVRSGSTNSNSGGTLHSATRVIVHESYNSSIRDYDFALIQVSPAFTFSDSVQPITLECDPVAAGTDVVVSGWGGPAPVTPPLRQVAVQIISDSECNSNYDYRGGITDRMICAGDRNGGKGACLGDEGGPLVASNKLVGIYSWVDGGCGFPQYPGVYTKVSALCNWIVINVGL